MATTISENSRELFLHIAEKHFHDHPLDHQYIERKHVVKMLNDYGETEKANELTELL